MSTYRYNFPTPIQFGNGVRGKIAPHLKEQGLKKPLVVTDRGVAQVGFFQDILTLLKKDGLQPAVFSEIWGNPVTSQVMAGVKAYKDLGCDSIVGLGGGAALDVAKAILLMIHHPGHLFDYEDDKPDGRPVDQEIPYWIAVPTTSGTGSEVGRSAVISDDQTHIKKIIFSPRLLAKAVFADPELTTGLPAKITAAVGFDALTHNVEAYLAKGFHPICDGIALEGVRLAAQHLVKAVREPNNLEARGGMMMSSMMGAIAFQKGLGLVHSTAHALSQVADLHHGLANAIMIDHALPHNVETVPERFRLLAQAAGLKESTPKAFLDWLGALKKECGIPAKLAESGVKPTQLDLLADQAFADVCHQSNPRACTRADFAKIFAAAI